MRCLGHVFALLPFYLEVGRDGKALIAQVTKVIRIVIN